MNRPVILELRTYGIIIEYMELDLLDSKDS